MNEEAYNTVLRSCKNVCEYCGCNDDCAYCNVSKIIEEVEARKAIRLIGQRRITVSMAVDSKGAKEVNDAIDLAVDTLRKKTEWRGV